MTTKLISTNGILLDKRDILSCEYIEQVNTQTDLQFGAAVAKNIHVQVWGEIDNAVPAGTQLLYYQVDEEENETLMGTFYVDAPTQLTHSTYEFYANDGISLLDRDISEWLRNNQNSFPMTIGTLADNIGGLCGMTIDTTGLHWASYTVSAFYADGLTARQIIQWIASIENKFAVCETTAQTNPTIVGEAVAGEAVVGGVYDVHEKIKFRGYTQNTTTSIAPSKATGVMPYFQDSLKYDNFVTAPIARAQYRAQDNDAGVIYPTSATGNTYAVESNLLIQSASAADLQAFAMQTYNDVQAIEYTPCSVKIPKTNLFHAGEVIGITDRDGNQIVTMVMKLTTSAEGTTLESTGNTSRGSNNAIAQQRYGNTEGRILRVSQSVEGLRVEAEDLRGRQAEVDITVGNIQAQVSETQAEAGQARDDAQNAITRVSTIEQTAQNVQIQVEEIVQYGVNEVHTTTGYDFDAEGLKIHKSGEEMENKLDNTGMYVTRKTGATDEQMLVANNEGVIATDVKVRNYLIVGEYSRFQDYGTTSGQHRTGCFHIDISGD